MERLNQIQHQANWRQRLIWWSIYFFIAIIFCLISLCVYKPPILTYAQSEYLLYICNVIYSIGYYLLLIPYCVFYAFGFTLFNMVVFVVNGWKLLVQCKCDPFLFICKYYYHPIYTLWKSSDIFIYRFREVVNLMYIKLCAFCNDSSICNSLTCDKNITRTLVNAFQNRYHNLPLEIKVILIIFLLYSIRLFCKYLIFKSLCNNLNRFKAYCWQKFNIPIYQRNTAKEIEVVKQKDEPIERVKHKVSKKQKQKTKQKRRKVPVEHEEISSVSGT